MTWMKQKLWNLLICLFTGGSIFHHFFCKSLLLWYIVDDIQHYVIIEYIVDIFDNQITFVTKQKAKKRLSESIVHEFELEWIREVL